MIDTKILEKWKLLIQAAKNYYIDSVPTGYTDFEYDTMEKSALEEDNFSVRDYVFDTYLKGVKTENHYIEKFTKTKVEGKTMLEAIKEIGPNDYWDLKYDGCSIAIYPDSKTGKPMRIVTVGNSNRSSLGVDQTWKLMKFMPKSFPKGIVAIQCEALIDLTRLPEGVDPERARQAVNGQINGKKEDVIEDVNNFLTLRAYRYYTDDTVQGKAISSMDYRTVLESFQTVYSPKDGHIMFAPADVFTVKELVGKENYCESDTTITTTGTFLNDGWVQYTNTGNCLGALKFAGAGSTTETLIKTNVKGIQWNDQTSKGKDSWSANVLIDPVVLHGSTVKKPSAGSVSKLVEKNITPGATVSVIMANSTIPMIGECFSPGNGDFNWPICNCGYQMSNKDVYGSLLKCGNPLCTERLDRMRKYINSLIDVKTELDLNKFLVIDRFKWESTDVDINFLLGYVEKDDEVGYYNYLISFMNTPLRTSNMNLVWKASFITLRERYIIC